ncbi:hypothetical protein TKK_0011628 [Trichogramma kaykai]
MPLYDVHPTLSLLLFLILNQTIAVDQAELVSYFSIEKIREIYQLIQRERANNSLDSNDEFKIKIILGLVRKSPASLRAGKIQDEFGDVIQHPDSHQKLKGDLREALSSLLNSRLQQHLPMIIPNVQQVESPIPSCPKESQFAQCSANQSQSSSKTESISVECGIEAAKSLPTKKAVPNLLPTPAVENTSMTSVATPVPAPIPPCSSELIPEQPNESPNIVEATPVPAPIPHCSNQMFHERENESPNIVPTSENFQKNQLVWAYYSKKWDYLPGIISRIEKKINKNTEMMLVTKIFVKYFEPPTGKKLKSWPHEPKKIKNLTADSIVEERQKRSTDLRLESYLKEMLKNSTTKATINFDIRIKNALNVL